MEVKSEVKFGDLTLKKAYDALATGKFSDKQLSQRLNRAFEDLSRNAFCGIQIAKRLIPKEYHSK